VKATDSQNLNQAKIKHTERFNK